MTRCHCGSMMEDGVCDVCVQEAIEEASWEGRYIDVELEPISDRELEEAMFQSYQTEEEENYVDEDRPY